MFTDFASPQPTIDAADLDVTILAQSLHDCFSLIQDHRSTRTLLHQLSDILTIAVLAVIAGGNGWEDMSLYGLSKFQDVNTWFNSLKISNTLALPIENSLHWVLDVTFNEDSCRVRSLHAPHNLALIRRFALNILNCEHTFKASLKQKSKRAAMDNRYMLTLLASAFPRSSATA
jgi:predicted transposase YbfD/YdcC